MPFFITLILLAILLFWIVWQYNTLVSERNKYKNAYAQIDVQLRRRYDLIPNLVETAKRYLLHEQQTLVGLAQARNMAIDAADLARRVPGAANSMDALARAEGGLGKQLSGFFAVAESYPELRADSTMMQLSEELSSTENRISFARQAYNDSVMDYNTRLEQFPANMIAGLFSFQAASVLAATENDNQRSAPTVKF